MIRRDYTMHSQNLLRANRRLKEWACVAFLFPALLTAQHSARLDISKYGMVSVGANEGLRLTAEATAGGRGCKAQLLFLSATGGSAGRSLSINLAPGTSAFDDLMPRGEAGKITSVKPTAWVDSAAGKEVDCTLSLAALGSTGMAVRTFQIPERCPTQECHGETVQTLENSRLRIYVFADDGSRCRAQLGFKLPQGGTSASSKYVNLMSNHGESLEWDPGEDEDLKPTDKLIPVVAFHEGDSCIASAEVLRGTSSATFVSVPVEFYPSPSVGLAMDPAALPATISKLSAAHAKSPNDLWVIDSLAQAYNRMGLRDMAIHLLTNSLASNPRDAASWYQLAKIQYDKKSFDDARQSLHNYLKLRPGDPQGLTALGLTLSQSFRFEEATRILSPLLENPSTRTPSALNAWAELLSAEGKNSDALRFVEESDRLHPNCKVTLYFKANILFAMGRIQESRDAAERAVQLDPDYGPARLLLVKVYTKEGKPEEAQQQESWLHHNLEATN